MQKEKPRVTITKLPTSSQYRHGTLFLRIYFSREAREFVGEKEVLLSLDPFLIRIPDIDNRKKLITIIETRTGSGISKLVFPREEIDHIEEGEYHLVSKDGGSYFEFEKTF